MISTNAIRNFADRVRATQGSNKDLILKPQEARLLNHEIQQLMARLIELQEASETGKIEVELNGTKF